jgi:ABC-type transport system involved in multi-copper enzyme maturation permease subunit
MAWRWGPGPVFGIELRGAARRWQTYATRSVFVAALLTAFGCVWWVDVGDRGSVRIADMAAVGERFYFALVGTQLALLLLAAPAATAGAVCLDKARGNLLHLLATDLSNAEIVLGKLFARLAPVFGLLLAGLPVLAVATLVGGIEPRSVFGAFLISTGVAVLGCALAITLSVWAGKTLEVLLAVYCLEAVALLALPMWPIVQQVVLGSRAWRISTPPPPWLRKSNPFWLAFAPYISRHASGPEDPPLFLAGALALSAALVLLAVATVRRAALRAAAAPARRPRRRLPLPSPWRLLPGPSLEGNPVLWREWHRRMPSRWLRVVWTLFALAAAGLTFMAFYDFLGHNRGARDFSALVNALIVTLGLLLFSVSAATSLSEERVRGSLDVLLTTPLSTASIVWGKWWGTFRTVPLLLVLPVLNLGGALWFGDSHIFWGSGPMPGWRMVVDHRWLFAPLVVFLTLAYGAMLTSLGLALATLMARPGRAAAWCVIAFVFMTIVPPVMGAVVSGLGPNRGFAWWGAASPFWGPGASTAMICVSADDDSRQTLLASGFVWGLAYLGLSVVLLAATLAVFDRCLGRVRQKRAEPPTFPCDVTLFNRSRP